MINGNCDRKRKFSLSISESVIEEVQSHYADDNCKSPSEFIEKAVRFYIGYLAAGRNQDFLSTVLTSTLKSIVSESDNRMGRLLFKIAVELAVLQNVAALDQDIDPVELERLRGICVKEVKRINGAIDFKDALEWQKE